MGISKILITGGAGYIGAHVVFALQSQGYDVVVYDDLSTGSRKNLLPKTSFVHASILDYKSLSRACAQYNPDAIIHLAALKAAGESLEKAVDYSDVNIVGTINLLNVMVKKNIKHIVFSSSAATYGNPQYLPIDETHVQLPINYYGATKLIIEQLLQWYSKAYSMNYASLRYFNAAGHVPSPKLTIIEPSPQNLIPVILEVAIGKREKLKIFGNDYNTHDGTCIRDYIHVSDLAEAHILSLKYLEAHQDSLELNLGTGKGYSVHEIYKATCNVTGRDIPVEFIDRREGDMDALYAKSMRAFRKIQWKPLYNDINEIISHAWAAYLREQRNNQSAAKRKIADVPLSNKGKTKNNAKLNTKTSAKTVGKTANKTNANAKISAKKTKETKASVATIKTVKKTTSNKDTTKKSS